MRRWCPCLWPLKLAIQSRHQPHSPNLGKKGDKELRRLVCSINYDANNGSASSRRLLLVFYEAQVVILECMRVE